MLKKLLSLICFPCWDRCGDKRLHFTCFRCGYRRALKNKGKLEGYTYNKTLKVFIPNRKRVLSHIWYDFQDVQNWDDARVYILYVNENRRFRAVKDILLNKLWQISIRHLDRADRAKFLKRIVSITENLAS